MAERAAMLVGHPVPTTWARNCTKPADANSPGSGGGDGDAEAATELRKRYLIPCQSSCDCVDPDLAASRGLQAAEVEYVNGRIQWRMPSSRYLTWDQRNRMFVGHMDEDTSLGEPSDVMIRGGSSTGSGEEEVTSRLCVNGTCPWDEQEPGEPAAASVAAAALPQQSVPSLAHLANLRLSCTNTNRDRNGCAAGSQPYQRCANRACTGSSDCGSTCDCRKRKRGGQVDLRCRPKRTRINPRDLARQARRGIQQGAATDICACNVTYVSMGCCGAPAGLVHESPDMRMGSVWTSDDQQQALLKWDGPRASTQAAIDVVEEEEDEEDDEDEDETQVEE
ncbi:MAG: hypothetical protein M1838_002905 [Thelocarpon superellum]|nr:MAG: hypothetical protein M1838_002905 [Thelocarpon superellum]